MCQGNINGNMKCREIRSKNRISNNVGKISVVRSSGREGGGFVIALIVAGFVFGLALFMEWIIAIWVGFYDVPLLHALNDDALRWYHFFAPLYNGRMYIIARDLWWTVSLSFNGIIAGSAFFNSV